MIFRNVNGELIVLNKMDFANDKLYYEKIKGLKKLFLNQKKQVNNCSKKPFA